MKLEILGEVPRVAGRTFWNKTLPTEIVWDGTSCPQPTRLTIFRISYRTYVWRGPGGEPWSYEQLLTHHREQAVHFPGTGSFNEAVDIEYWQDEGDDGHTEYLYQRVYRMFMHPEQHDEHNQRWLGETSGSDIMQLLEEYVYELNREAQRAEQPTRP